MELPELIKQIVMLRGCLHYGHALPPGNYLDELQEVISLLESIEKSGVLLDRFEALASVLEKEGKAYSKLSDTVNGIKVDQTSQVSLGIAYSAGTYATCAKAIREEIKRIRRGLKMEATVEAPA